MHTRQHMSRPDREASKFVRFLWGGGGGWKVQSLWLGISLAEACGIGAWGWWWLFVRCGGVRVGVGRYGGAGRHGAYAMRGKRMGWSATRDGESRRWWCDWCMGG
ncbi:hypothetical protein BDU57DRAFT_91195 [Ampelomyces quisqualis]|uniref:Uncharacterized protein n=1 Tax=Ampelomyces quisqualis TaxID=50730 RepID=A0A6A5Q8Z1_AMPQU|nr:hypothetical protein BDU57DRAFT_91195 [Ampelomyces quisqualis]